MKQQFPVLNLKHHVRKTRRAGVTMLEVLVVLSVIALVMSLVIPGILAVRESSRLASCRNRLRQMGIAIQTFESVKRRLPGEISSSPSGRLKRRISPHVQLLPYLDQGVLADSLLSTVGRGRMDELPMMKALKTTVPALLCPSDPNAGPGVSFRFCTGPSPTMHERKFEGATVGGGGAFAPQVTTSQSALIASIVDGLSNTVAMSERLLSQRDNGWNRQTNMWLTGAFATRTHRKYMLSAANTAKLCGMAPPKWSNGRGVQMGWFFVDSSYSNTFYNHVLSPNSATCDCSIDAPLDIWGRFPSPSFGSRAAASSARSNHSAGAVNVLFLDGAVQSMAETIDPEVWQAISTRFDADPDRRGY